MPHVPSFPDQIARRLLARFTSITGASTANLNGDLATAFGLISDEMSLIDRNFIAEYVRAHWFEGNPELVLQRSNDMPLMFPRQQPAKAAVGGAVTLTRSTFDFAYTYPALSIVINSLERPDIYYYNVEPVFFGLGVETVVNQVFVCASTGTVGTQEKGVVSLVSSSADGNILSCTNEAAFVGRDAETADQVRGRAYLWMASLAQTQQDALVSVARNFVDPDGATIINAHAQRDPDMRGITYLTVDDGAAMVGYEQPAETTYGTFGTLAPGLRHLLMFNAPAATPPKLYVGSSEFTASARAWSSLDEAGEMWLRRDASAYGIDTTPGTAWEIRAYMKYTGILERLQKYINRMCTASGNRVILRPPVAQDVTLSGIIVTDVGTGRTRQRILQSCKDVTLAYIRSLNMGAQLKQHDLHHQLRMVSGVLNYIPDQGDIYPGGPFYKLVPNPSFIAFR